jgi:hypothetical protein
MYESAAYQLADIEELFGSDAVVDCELNDYLSFVENELVRRMELHRKHPELWNKGYEAWRELAEQVNARADIVEIFQEAGFVLAYAGSNSQRASEEWAGRCPFCGGKDRFRVWTAGRFGGGGYWCRQCDKSGDAIAAYRNIRNMTNTSFTETVRELAARLGISTEAVNRKNRKGSDCRQAVKIKVKR